MVVEDAAAGIKAALMAGMWTVGSVEQVGAAHILLPSLEGVTWADLQSKFSCTTTCQQAISKLPEIFYCPKG